MGREVGAQSPPPGGPGDLSLSSPLPAQELVSWEELPEVELKSIQDGGVCMGVPGMPPHLETFSWVFHTCLEGWLLEPRTWGNGGQMDNVLPPHSPP